MDKQTWTQELLWVKRNRDGVIVGIQEKTPQHGDIVPLVPRKEASNKQAVVVGD
ncbi:hypothetical protein [Paenibacillus sp. OV219]|uniref:hypothetical protein n=1 Tax=Paenibacillus sp. OV219 TaxID=1884377 RepID=UPI0015A5FDB4|nr:hypothetical protein [Paenibacillus sp. OV219]